MCRYWQDFVDRYCSRLYLEKSITKAYQVQVFAKDYPPPSQPGPPLLLPPSLPPEWAWIAIVAAVVYQTQSLVRGTPLFL